MKIIHLVPGSGGSFYCGNCMRDSVYVNALRDFGNDVVMLPLYLPLNENDYGNFGNHPVFFGAVSLYLKQMVPFLRNMPNWLEKVFDSPFMLKMAAKKAGSTRAAGLEEMTINMLKGEEGQQKKELQQLVDWLKKEDTKPDVIHLSNALLIGLAHQLKTEIDVPIVCSLQDENVWLDVMDEPFRSTCWNMIEERSKYVDAFVSSSNYFMRFMQERINLPDHKVYYTQPGIDVKNYPVQEKSPSIPTIGFMSRLCEANGLEILIDAFILLKKNPQFKDVQLKLTGGHTADDKVFLKNIHKKLLRADLLHSVTFIHNFYGEERLIFLNSITLLSVPVINGEALGLYQLEALACGIPVVQPNEGAFPEIVEATHGGWIYEPNSAEALSQKLAEVLAIPSQIKEKGLSGRRYMETTFNSTNMAKDMANVYQNILK